MNKVLGSELPITAQVEQVQPGGTAVIMNMEQLIKSHIDSIGKLTAELKKNKSMLDDIFVNDPTYQSHDKTVKEATKVRAATKNQILKLPQAADLANKTKSIRSEIKDLKSALSDYLLEYQRMTQATQLELFDGEVVEIVKSAKVVRKFNGK